MHQRMPRVPCSHRMACRGVPRATGSVCEVLGCSRWALNWPGTVVKAQGESKMQQSHKANCVPANLLV